MLDFLQILINFIWSISSIDIPFTPTIHFTIWQFFLTIAIMAIAFKQLMKTADKGGQK